MKQKPAVGPSNEPTLAERSGAMAGTVLNQAGVAVKSLLCHELAHGDPVTGALIEQELDQLVETGASIAKQWLGGEHAPNALDDALASGDALKTAGRLESVDGPPLASHPPESGPTNQRASRAGLEGGMDALDQAVASGSGSPETNTAKQPDIADFGHGCGH